LVSLLLFGQAYQPLQLVEVDLRKELSSDQEI